MVNETRLSWGLRRLRIEACWRAGWTGAGVYVGHLDTGVDATHPALAGRVATFAEFDAEGVIVADARPHDTGIHGTHTGGLICGGAASGQVIGVAPDARLCSGVVIEGGHVLARVLSGIDWMFDRNVRVVCLSLGMPGYHPLFEIALARLRQCGVLVVCPVGNGGRGTACSPALYPGVLAVGATDQEDRVARFSGDGRSQRGVGAELSLVAPGVGVRSSEPGGRMAIRDGTSMAAAYVAGVAALLFQACPNATVGEVERALFDSAEPLMGVPHNRQGRGLVNPLGALQLLLTGAMEPCPHHSVSIRG
jgi:subtilisin family serine protease